MTQILRMNDRITLKIGDITFYLAPLNHGHKMQLTSMTKVVKGEEIYDFLGAQAYYIKHGLKDVEGIETYDGEKYELQFEGNELTDDCVSEILNLEQKSLLTTAAWQLLEGVKDLIDPITQEKLEGVEMKVVPGKK